MKVIKFLKFTVLAFIFSNLSFASQTRNQVIEAIAGITGFNISAVAARAAGQSISQLENDFQLTPETVYADDSEDLNYILSDT